MASKEILEKLDEGMFVRTLQCLAAQQQKNQGSHGKEPSLMPVPSPQQISYLNQFEGNLAGQLCYVNLLESTLLKILIKLKKSSLNLWRRTVGGSIFVEHDLVSS